jgi:hypothetical protein
MRLKSHVSGVGHGRIRGCVSDTLAYVCARISHFLLFRKKKINQIPVGYDRDTGGIRKYPNPAVFRRSDTTEHTLSPSWAPHAASNCWPPVLLRRRTARRRADPPPSAAVWQDCRLVSPLPISISRLFLVLQRRLVLLACCGVAGPPEPAPVGGIRGIDVSRKP